MSHIKRVKVLSNQLEVGMFISDIDRDWSETNFLLQGFTVQDQDDIDAVKEQCDYVYVDFPDENVYKQFRAKATVSHTLRAKLEKDLEEPIQSEIPKATKVHKKSIGVVKGILERVMLGEDFEIGTVKEQVKECVKSIMRNENALLMMTLIKHKDEYTAEHCLNVGILSIAFAKFLGYEEDELQDIGLAGMLHDIGKVKIPDNILNKPSRLTGDEMTQMREHARLGHELLLGKRDVSPLAIDVAYAHHEKLDGSGYPRGLSEGQITPVTRLVSVVDAFDAITSDRCYDKSRPIMEAYKVLMKHRGHHFDPQLVTRFVEWRGIYPPGSIVEMANGEVGIVIATNPRYKLRPKVMLILDERKERRKRERIIDMSKLDLDATAQTYRIIKAVQNRAFGVDLQAYVDRGLRIAAV